MVVTEYCKLGLRKLSFLLLGLVVVLILFLLLNGRRTEKQVTQGRAQEESSLPLLQQESLSDEVAINFASKSTLSFPRSESTSDTFNKKEKPKFPTAIIIGVKKGGTRALISMLSLHPDIRIAKEEVQFFSYNYQKGMKWYLERMPKASKGQVTMEKSPNYFDLSSFVPQRVYSHSKTVKLILIVRNPIDRAVSDYVQYVDQHKKSMPPKFEKLVVSRSGKVISNDPRKFIGRSKYDIHYKNWRKYFKKSQLLVLNGDELISDPTAVLQKVEKFLSVRSFFQHNMFILDEKKGFYCWNKRGKSVVDDDGDRNETEARCLGSSKGRPHPEISEDVRTKLTEYFRPHMKSFCSYASVKFSWCNL